MSAVSIYLKTYLKKFYDGTMALMGKPVSLSVGPVAPGERIHSIVGTFKSKDFLEPLLLYFC
jgi:hypothetical protein